MTLRDRRQAQDRRAARAVKSFSVFKGLHTLQLCTELACIIGSDHWRSNTINLLDPFSVIKNCWLIGQLVITAFFFWGGGNSAAAGFWSGFVSVSDGTLCLSQTGKTLLMMASLSCIYSARNASRTLGPDVHLTDFRYTHISNHIVASTHTWMSKPAGCLNGDLDLTPSCLEKRLRQTLRLELVSLDSS